MVWFGYQAGYLLAMDVDQINYRPKKRENILIYIVNENSTFWLRPPTKYWSNCWCCNWWAYSTYSRL